MSYVDPDTVRSPKKRWTLGKVLYVDEEDGWSVAEGEWKHGEKWGTVLAIRWNGDKDHRLGNPQSSGHPTWFIVPSELEKVLRNKIDYLRKKRDKTRV